MSDTEKARLLLDKLSKLQHFRSTLSIGKKEEFKQLQKEIADLLDDNQRKRFFTISFYSETDDWTIDLPF